MPAIRDLVKQLLDALNKIMTFYQSRVCECYARDEYEQLVKQLNDTINRLNQWLRMIQQGVIGEPIYKAEDK
jgi:uncharacterized protein YukE